MRLALVALVFVSACGPGVELAESPGETVVLNIPSDSPSPTPSAGPTPVVKCIKVITTKKRLICIIEEENEND